MRLEGAVPPPPPPPPPELSSSPLTLKRLMCSLGPKVVGKRGPSSAAAAVAVVGCAPKVGWKEGEWEEEESGESTVPFEEMAPGRDRLVFALPPTRKSSPLGVFVSLLLPRLPLFEGNLPGDGG